MKRSKVITLTLMGASAAILAGCADENRPQPPRPLDFATCASQGYKNFNDCDRAYNAKSGILPPAPDRACVQTDNKFADNRCEPQQQQQANNTARSGGAHIMPIFIPGSSNSYYYGNNDYSSRYSGASRYTQPTNNFKTLFNRNPLRSSTTLATRPLAVKPPITAAKPATSVASRSFTATRSVGMGSSARGMSVGA